MFDCDKGYCAEPVIHSINGLGFGDGNEGELRFDFFKKTHICNRICLKLKLNKLNDILSDSAAKAVMQFQSQKLQRQRQLQKQRQQQQQQMRGYQHYMGPNSFLGGGGNGGSGGGMMGRRAMHGGRMYGGSLQQQQQSHQQQQQYGYYNSNMSDYSGAGGTGLPMIDDGMSDVSGYSYVSFFLFFFLFFFCL